MPAQARSSKSAPSNSNVRVQVAPVTPYGTSELAGPVPWASGSGYSGYGAYTPIPSTQTPEALRKQQEEFARAAELRQTLANLEKVDDEGRRSSLLDTLCSTEDVLGLPEHPNPPGIASGELRVDLLKHQVRGRSFVRLCAGSQFACMFAYRNKRFYGRLSTRTQNSQRKKTISQCNSGSTERQVPRCVQSPSCTGCLLNILQAYYYNSTYPSLSTLVVVPLTSRSSCNKDTSGSSPYAREGSFVWR